MQWFGEESWGAATCTPETRAPVPVGQSCACCYKAILRGESGLLIPHTGPHLAAVTVRPWHLDCFLASVGVGRFAPGALRALAQCEECGGAGGAPVHPEQPCPGCGWYVFSATASEGEVDRMQSFVDKEDGDVEGRECAGKSARSGTKPL